MVEQGRNLAFVNPNGAAALRGAGSLAAIQSRFNTG